MIEQDHIFDKRIIDRNMARGRLTQQQYDEHIKALADQADGAEDIEVEVSQGEFKVDFPAPEE